MVSLGGGHLERGENRRWSPTPCLRKDENYQSDFLLRRVRGDLRTGFAWSHSAHRCERSGGR